MKYFLIIIAVFICGVVYAEVKSEKYYLEKYGWTDKYFKDMQKQGKKLKKEREKRIKKVTPVPPPATSTPGPSPTITATMTRTPVPVATLTPEG